MDPYAVKALGGELMGDAADDDRSLRAKLPSITCPTTVIVGEHDHPMVDQAPELASAVADGELTVIPGRVPLPGATHVSAVENRRRGASGPGCTDRIGAVSDVSPPQASDLIELAGTDVAIPPLGVGTWAWGDKGSGAWAATTSP